MAFLLTPKFEALLKQTVAAHGGPGPFTTDFLRHVKEVGEDNLSDREAALLDSLRLRGTEGFTKLLTDRYGLPEPQTDLSLGERVLTAATPAVGPIPPLSLGGAIEPILSPAKPLAEDVTARLDSLRRMGIDELIKLRAEPHPLRTLGEDVITALPRIGALAEDAVGNIQAGVEKAAQAFSGELLKRRTRLAGGGTVPPPPKAVRALGNLGPDALRITNSVITFFPDIYAQELQGRAREAAQTITLLGPQAATGEEIGFKGLSEALAEHPIGTALGAVAPFSIAAPAIVQTFRRTTAGALPAAAEQIRASVPLSPSEDAALASTVDTHAATVETRLDAEVQTPPKKLTALDRILAAKPSTALAPAEQAAPATLAPGTLPLEPPPEIPVEIREAQGAPLTAREQLNLVERRAAEFDRRQADQVAALEAQADRVAPILPSQAELLRSQADAIRGGPERRIEERRQPGRVSNLVEDAAVARAEPDRPVVENGVAQPAVLIGGAVARAALEHPANRFVASLFGSLPGHPSFLEVGRWIADRVDGFIDATTPFGRQLRKDAPDFYEAVVHTKAGNVFGRIRGFTYHAILKDEFLATPQLQEDFARLVVSERGKRTLQTNPQSRVPILDPAEEARILAEPEIQGAIEYYRTNATPELKLLAPEAGITTFVEDPLGIYAKLHVIDPKDIGKFRGATLDTGGRRSTPLKFRKRKAGAAQPALGTGEFYSIDLKDILQHQFSDRYAAVYQRRLFDAAKAEAVDPILDDKGQPTNRYPDTVEFGGREVRVVQLSKVQGSFIINERVPEPIRQAFEEALNPPNIENSAGLRWLRPIMNVALKSQLAIPAEAVVHGLNVYGALYTAPGIAGSGMFSNLASALVPLYRNAAVFARIYNVHGVEALEDFTRLSKLGVIRESHFDIPPGRTPIGKVINIPRQVVFGAPKIQNRGIARGVQGLETRGRLVLYRLLKEHGISDREAAYLINNQLGTYVLALQPKMVQLLRATWDPFAAAGISITKTAVKGIFGFGPAGFDPVLLSSNWLAPAIGILLANRAVSGKWWWEPGGGMHEGLRPGDIRVHRDDGKVVDIPLRLIYPGLARGLRATGIQEALNEAARGNYDAGTLAMAMARGAFNTLFVTRANVLFRTAVAAISGRITYLGRDFTPIRVARQSETRQLLENMRVAWSQLNPISGEPGLITEPGHLLPDSQAAKLAFLFANVLGSEPIIRPGERELAGQTIRGKRGRLFEVAQDIAFQAGRVPVADRAAYINERIGRDLLLPDRARGRRLVYQLIRRRTRSIGRSFAEATRPPETEPGPELGATP